MFPIINGFGLGCVAGEPDYRDYRLAREIMPVALPAEIDLRPQSFGVYNQSYIGSCTAHGVGRLFRFVNKKIVGVDDYLPSRLQIYYDARKMRGWQLSDTGAVIGDAMKVVVDVGAGPERLWPYDVAQFTIQPPPKVYKKARNHQALVYYRVRQNPNDIKSCLAAGYPVVLGSTLYENFGTIGADGLMPMPAGKKAGGHCYLLEGYNEARRRYIAANSWGEEWGDKGFFYPPYDYIHEEDLTFDLWTIRQVEVIL